MTLYSLRSLVFFIVILTLPYLCLSKFSTTYRGTAATGLQTCLNNSVFTPETIVLRENCREGFRCVMDNIPSFGQSILSSGAAILGFIPTVLLVLGSTNAEIARIHARYPLLAFFLSITNVNKRPDKQQTVTPPDKQQTVNPSHGTTNVMLGPYGVVKQRDPNAEVSTATNTGIYIVHILAATGAAIVIWQTVEIGRNAVLSWACWTDFYPVVWIGLAVVHHVLSIGFMRASLRVTEPVPETVKSQDLTQRCVSAFGVWDLTSDKVRVKVGRMRFAKWSKAAADLVNNVNYLYGTAVFTSLTLVSGVVAIQKLGAFGIVAVGARIATVWVLEDIEGEERGI